MTARASALTTRSIPAASPIIRAVRMARLYYRNLRSAGNGQGPAGADVGGVTVLLHVVPPFVRPPSFVFLGARGATQASRRSYASLWPGKECSSSTSVIEASETRAYFAGDEVYPIVYTSSFESVISSANPASASAGDEQHPHPLEVSVITPWLNEAKTLGVCIEKIQKTFQREEIGREIVVADNGSSDDSQEIALSLALALTLGCEILFSSFFLSGLGLALLNQVNNVMQSGLS